MIGQLKGIIEEIDANRAVIDVGGVGYLVYASSRTLSSLTVGEGARLLIDTIVREESITLYGFAAAGEQSMFRLLTTVQGVGARVGLALLSALSPTELTQAVLLGDAKTLSRADGVGPKLASRIASELKDKIAAHHTSFLSAAASGPVLPNVATLLTSIAGDAIAALAGLGYRRVDIVPVVAQLAANDPGLALDALIKLALRELAA